MGNSPKVAQKHYLQVTEEHFEKAVQNPVQQPAATPGKPVQVKMKKPRTTLETSILRGLGIAAEGFEPPTRGL